MDTEIIRLKAFADNYFESLSGLAKAMNKHEKTFYPYLKKGEIGRRMMKDLLEFGISEKFLSGIESEPFANSSTGQALKEKYNSNQSPLAQPLQREETNVINQFSKLGKGMRVFLTPANAGRGFALDDIPDAYDKRELFANSDDIIVVPVSGESMQPDLYDGDKVYVDTSRRTPKSGEMTLCNVDGVNYVKYYLVVNGKSYLCSKNPQYPPMHINGFNNSIVYGVIVQIARVPMRSNTADFQFPVE